MGSRLGLSRLRLEKPAPKPCECDGCGCCDGRIVGCSCVAFPVPKLGIGDTESKSGCDHEWDDVEPNPDSTRTIRVCLLCGLAAGTREDGERDE